MSGLFDAYHKWLGIAPSEQPPTLYRLLGLRDFEADRTVIRNAADRQTTHLRSYQLSQYSSLSERLLNEVAKARLTLLDEEKKAEYDRQLGNEPKTPPVIRLEPVAPLPDPLQRDVPVPPRPLRSLHRAPQRIKQPGLAFPLFCVTLLAVLGYVVLNQFRSLPSTSSPVGESTELGVAASPSDAVGDSKPEPATEAIPTPSRDRQPVASVAKPADEGRLSYDSADERRFAYNPVDEGRLAYNPTDDGQSAYNSTSGSGSVFDPVDDDASELDPNSSLSSSSFRGVRKRDQVWEDGQLPGTTRDRPVVNARRNVGGPWEEPKPAARAAWQEGSGDASNNPFTNTKPIELPSGKTVAGYELLGNADSLLQELEQLVESSDRSVVAFLRPGGKPMALAQQEAGELHGPAILLHGTGRIKMAVRFNRGERDGFLRTWDEDQQRRFWCRYVQGKRDGMGYWFEEDQLCMVIEYTRNRPVGYHVVRGGKLAASFLHHEEVAKDELAARLLAAFLEYEEEVATAQRRLKSLVRTDYRRLLQYEDSSGKAKPKDLHGWFDKRRDAPHQVIQAIKDAQ